MTRKPAKAPSPRKNKKFIPHEEFLAAVIEGLNNLETLHGVAEKLSMSPKMVSMRLSIVRRRLREEAKKQGIKPTEENGYLLKKFLPDRPSRISWERTSEIIKATQH